MKTFEFLLKTGERLVGRGSGLFMAWQSAVKENVMYGDGTRYSLDRDVVNHTVSYS